MNFYIKTDKKLPRGRHKALRAVINHSHSVFQKSLFRQAYCPFRHEKRRNQEDPEYNICPFQAIYHFGLCKPLCRDIFRPPQWYQYPLL